MGLERSRSRAGNTNHLFRRPTVRSVVTRNTSLAIRSISSPTGSFVGTHMSGYGGSVDWSGRCCGVQSSIEHSCCRDVVGRLIRPNKAGAAQYDCGVMMTKDGERAVRQCENRIQRVCSAAKSNIDVVTCVCRGHCQQRLVSVKAVHRN